MPGRRRPQNDASRRVRQARATIALTVLCAFAAATSANAASSIAHIHGKIISIDTKRGTFLIRHDPFAQMPMMMTMEAKPKRRADLDKLHAGETIDATIDTAIDPWPATEIRPALATKAKRPPSRS